MPSYLPWLLGLATGLGLATWGSVEAWKRWFRRDHAAVLRLVAMQEKAAQRQREAERQALAALALSERRHRALAKAGAVALFLADAEGRLRRLDGAWMELTGQSEDEVIGSDRAWAAALHPDERAATLDAWLLSVATGVDYEAEYRVMTGEGDWRWCRARSVPIREEPTAPGDPGRIVEWVGVVEDVDARRRAEAQRSLLAREVDHRAKNLLAVVQAVVRMAAASDAEVSVINDRIAALARAHDLLAAAHWRGAALREVAERELAPYRGAEGATLVELEGPPVLLAADATQPVAMLLHELATNAAKHGCLGRGDRLHVRWELDGPVLRILWRETGGSAPAAPPDRRGFGYRLMDATIGGQLGGSITREWLPEGLLCRVELPLARVTDADRSAAAERAR